jgi:hypothetical protein
VSVCGGVIGKASHQEHQASKSTRLRHYARQERTREQRDEGRGTRDEETRKQLEQRGEEAAAAYSRPRLSRS